MFEINRSMVDNTTEVLELVVDELSVKILPNTGNLLYSLQYNKTEFLWFPFEDLAEYCQNPRLAGIPLLAPWANRLDEAGFDFNGIHHSLNTSIDFSKDANGLPMHGLLAFTDKWERRSEVITDEFVEVNSRLKFWKHADLMTHFPFAHELQLTYRLYSDKLEVDLQIINKGKQSMPVMIGFHPYFQLPDTDRKKWTVSIPAKQQLVLDDHNLPTGMTTSNPYLIPQSLGTNHLDDVYSQLTGDPFVVSSSPHTIKVLFDYGYSAAVVYAPLSRDVICFEPMTAPTNSLSRYHRDKSINLPVIQSDESWKGRFTITVI